jgi:hypothetical protein
MRRHRFQLLPTRERLLATREHLTRFSLVLGTAVAVAAISSCSPQPGASVPPPKTKLAAIRPGSIYWGARIGSQLTGHQAPWSRKGISAFDALAGKQVSVVHFEAPFANCSVTPCSFYAFPLTPMNTIRSMGAIPFFSWSSQSTPSHFNEPSFSLAQLISGRYDSYIRSFAQSAKRWGHPFFLRLDWDMNAYWAPWAESVNGNSAGEYVAAWRHVHDIFASVGADNVTWVWCPEALSSNSVSSLAELYPGNAYVDWTCLSGYNFGTNRSDPMRWQTFDDLFSSSYQEIVDQVAPSKPMIIGEIASSEDGGSKSSWIANMLRELPIRYPQVRGVIWSEYYYQGADWPIETSAASAAAFSAGVRGPAYVAGHFRGLGSGLIRPPTADGTSLAAR